MKFDGKRPNQIAWTELSELVQRGVLEDSELEYKAFP